MKKTMLVVLSLIYFTGTLGYAKATDSLEDTKFIESIYNSPLMRYVQTLGNDSTVIIAIYQQTVKQNELLEHIRHISEESYKKQLNQLAEAEKTNELLKSVIKNKLA